MQYHKMQAVDVVYSPGRLVQMSYVHFATKNSMHVLVLRRRTETASALNLHQVHDSLQSSSSSSCCWHGAPPVKNKNWIVEALSSPWNKLEGGTVTWREGVSLERAVPPELPEAECSKSASSSGPPGGRPPKP